MISVKFWGCILDLYPFPAICSVFEPVFVAAEMPPQGFIVLAVYLVFMFLTLAIYFEEVHFIIKNFKMKTRKRATIWILAFFPVSNDTTNFW